MMKRKFLAQAAATGLEAVVLPTLAAGQAPPPMGGGYTNVIPIPVDEPKTKAISGERRADDFIDAHMPSK